MEGKLLGRQAGLEPVPELEAVQQADSHEEEDAKEYRHWDVAQQGCHECRQPDKDEHHQVNLRVDEEKRGL